MKKLLLLCTTFLLMLACFTSCVKSDDFSGLDNIKGEANPIFGLPLLYGELGMENLINTSGNMPVTITMSNDGYYLVSYLDTIPVVSQGSYGGKKLQRTTKDEDIITIGPKSETIEVTFFANEEYGDVQLNIINIVLDAKASENVSARAYNLSAVLVMKSGSTVNVPMNAVDFNATTTSQQLLSVNLGPYITTTDPVVSIVFNYTVDVDINTVLNLPNLSLDLIAKVELGMYGYANHMQYLDTLDFSIGTNDTDTDSDSISKYLQSAVIYYSFENGFPFDLDMQLYFLDADYRVQDSLFSPVGLRLASAPVSNEIATGTTKTTGSVSKNHEELTRLTGLNYAVIRASFSTKDAPSKSVKISDKNKLKANLGAKIQAIINDELLND